MSIYVYAPKQIPSAVKLTEALQASRIGRFDGMRLCKNGRPHVFEPTDSVVCFGSHIPNLEGVIVINALNAHPDQLDINLKLTLKYGITAIQLRRMTESSYNDGLAKLQKGKIEKIVASKDFPNYGTSKYSLNNLTKIHVIGNEVVKAEIRYVPEDNSRWYAYKEADVANDYKNLALNCINKIGLQFGVVYMGTMPIVGSDQAPVVRKILTMPELSDSDALLYAKQIKNLIIKIQEK